MKVPTPEIWFVTGSQHLYGPGPLKQVAANSQEIVEALNRSKKMALPLVFKSLVTRSEEIRRICQEASSEPNCAGLILWMHTFSPSKMWIGGLNALRKPFLHLHTQFNRDLPWSEIDMDFMNLNQSAHGDREAGFIHTRLRLNRKVVVGHWSDAEVQERIGVWMRVARAWNDWQGAEFARFADNMRYVAVTEGDKVSAEARFGYSVNHYAVGDLVQHVNAVSDAAITNLCTEYEERYSVAAPLRKDGARHESLRDGARIELGLRSFLEEGNFKGFTTTFEDLHGLKQLPGLAVQRLMGDGYGFGGEGDWKTSGLVRIMKIMATGQSAGTSFMEDYTYHLEPGNELVLGAHMLEICPSIAATKPRIEVHPLGIGGKADPARLVFDGASGPAINASLIDLGTRFRLIINEVDSVQPTRAMPKLPVARVLWKAQPSLRVAAETWILAGGAHHTGFSLALTAEQMIDWAELNGIEYLLINKDTNPLAFRNELRWSDAAWKLR